MYACDTTQPLPGHAICNIGDALSVFSGGILQSNIHRVVPPPGIQGAYERWSLVFFTRPGNSRVLRALVENSPLIADAVREHPDRNFDTGSTAAEWFARRIKYQRINNRQVSREQKPPRRQREIFSRFSLTHYKLGSGDMGCKQGYRTYSHRGMMLSVQSASGQLNHAPDIPSSFSRCFFCGAIDGRAPVVQEEQVAMP